MSIANLLVLAAILVVGGIVTSIVDRRMGINPMAIKARIIHDVIYLIWGAAMGVVALYIMFGPAMGVVVGRLLLN